jgi:hypothetical protein
MRLLTLLAGYAAGLAVAMKYRKDSGKSKIDTSSDNTSKFNSFIDEVVDIHKTAFADVKWFVKANFDDVDNFDDLKVKVSQIVLDFWGNLESHIENAKKTGISKKEELIKAAQEFLQNHETTLEQAKAKAASFAGVSEDAIDSWLEQAKSEIKQVFETVQSKFDTEAVSEKPKKTTTPRKTTIKKTTPKSE